MYSAHAQIIGERIRVLRERTGISLRAFASQHDFNPNVLSRIERGAHNMTLDTLFKVASALEVSAAKLLRGI